MNKLFALLVFLVFCFAGSAELVAGPLPKIATTADNIAIQGYDPVAYFTMSRPMKGSPEHEYVWEGARWQFANAEHKKMFTADPARYAPQWGGYCAGGMVMGMAYHPLPDVWAIVDGKLFLRSVPTPWAEWRRTADLHTGARNYSALTTP